MLSCGYFKEALKLATILKESNPDIRVETNVFDRDGWQARLEELQKVILMQ
jgi:hypothetical protein